MLQVISSYKMMKGFRIKTPLFTICSSADFIMSMKCLLFDLIAVQLILYLLFFLYVLRSKYILLN